MTPMQRYSENATGRTCLAGQMPNPPTAVSLIAQRACPVGIEAGDFLVQYDDDPYSLAAFTEPSFAQLFTPIP